MSWRLGKSCAQLLTAFCEPLPRCLGNQGRKKWLRGRGQERREHNVTENNVTEMENKLPSNRKTRQWREKGEESKWHSKDTGQRREQRNQGKHVEEIRERVNRYPPPRVACNENKAKTTSFFNNSALDHKQNYLLAPLSRHNPKQIRPRQLQPMKNVAPANQYPFRNNELQEGNPQVPGRRCISALFSLCLSSSWSVLKSIWPMPPIFNNFEIHFEGLQCSYRLSNEERQR